MTVFLLVSGLLIAGVLIHMLRPLLRSRRATGVSHDDANVAVYRDQLRELESDLRAGTIAQENYAKARQEIEKRLLDDVGGSTAKKGVQQPSVLAAIVLGLAVPFCALAVYLVVGTPAAVVPGAIQQAAAGSHDLNAQQIAGMAERLAARLKENPDNAEGWLMLGRTYGAIGRFSDAAAAYSEAEKRDPNNAQLLADYADALGMAQGRSLSGEPEKLVARALKADPKNIKALALAGTAAFDRKAYAEAAKQWERLLEVSPPDSELAQAIRGSVDEARSLAGQPPLAKSAGAPQVASAPVTQPAAQSATPGGRITGVARLSPKFAQKVTPNDTVFIFAHSADSRMPIAILRKQASDLPVSFVLDDSTAMNPDARLSSFPNVIVSARVSKKGSAMPTAGDLQGQTAPVRVGSKGIEVVIDSEVN